ncbi:MAG: ABC transporter ATP-binding protein [bacterium]
MIEVKDLHKSLGDEKVLEGINLSINRGELFALLGGSGAGKSVLIKNIVGLMKPDRGEVLIKNQDIHKTTGKKLEELRRSIGMLFQGGALFDSMTVYENLAFPLREKTNLSKDEISQKIKRQLNRVELPGSEQKYPAELSGGMKKRVALARCLILEPEIIFFDEPTTGLDPLISNAILRLIYNIHRELEITAIIITHDLDKIFPIVQKTALIHEGKILDCQSPEEFMKSEQPVIKEFVTEATRGPLEAINNA